MEYEMKTGKSQYNPQTKMIEFRDNEGKFLFGLPMNDTMEKALIDGILSYEGKEEMLIIASKEKIALD